MKLSFSNVLLVICLIITLISFNIEEMYIFWMNNYFLDRWLYHVYFFQFFSSTFIHWSILHLLMNSVFLVFFWNIVEKILWYKNMIIFYIFAAVFVWLWISYFSNWNTVWMSGFLMALLSYYTLYLYDKNDPEYKWWVTAIFVSVIIWLDPGISFYWHFFGSIAWILFFLFNKKFLKKQYIGVVE
jgi:membrane associated rhomboid family serine protease